MKLIVAVDRNWAIGKDGDQLAYLSTDLRRFKEITMGHPILLGRKTLATFPGGRPLKGRRNLILSRTPGFQVEGAEVFGDLESVQAAAPADTVVVGGGSVYQALLPWCDTAYVTRMEAEFPADTWFPNLDQDPDWTVLEQSDPMEEKGISFRYVTYAGRGG